MVVSSQCRACQTHFQVVDGKAVSKKKTVEPFARIRKATDENADEETLKQESHVTPFTRIRKETEEEEDLNQPRVAPFTRIHKASEEDEEDIDKTIDLLLELKAAHSGESHRCKQHAEQPIFNAHFSHML